MSQRSREILKSFFEKGDFPTQAEFIDFIDSCLNLVDDSVGGGDMFKSVYDSEDNGIVNDSRLINGNTVANDLSVQANTSKNTNVSTNLSEGTSTETTVDVDSSDGTNATLVAASTSRAGLLTKAKFDEIVANTAKVSYENILFVISAAASDVDSDLEVGTNKAVFFAPYDMTLTEIFAGLGTVCTGSTFITDVNVNGSSILSAKISIDASESTSLTAATPPVISSASLTKGDKMEIDFDQVGAINTGKAHTVYLKGTLS